MNAGLESTAGHEGLCPLGMGLQSKGASAYLVWVVQQDSWAMSVALKERLRWSRLKWYTNRNHLAMMRQMAAAPRLKSD